MRTWSDSPFDPVTNIAEVPVGRVLSEDDGESRLVYEIDGRPQWLAKIYKKPLPGAEAHTLRRLVHLPVGMFWANLTVVDSSIAWPVAAIVDGLRTVGVVMAKAPARFSARLRKLSGGYEEAKPLPIDWLVMPSESSVKRGIEPTGPETRRKAMLELLRVGALFDDHDIVYADWSYKNAFWEQGVGSVFVIDMDSCGIGTRAWIESPEWDDPLFPESTKPRLNCLSDRYKLAVLAVRCMTGERKDPLAAHRSLVESVGTNAFTSALHQVLTAKVAEDRLSPYHLLGAYQRWIAVMAGNVSGSVSVGRAARADDVEGSSAPDRDAQSSDQAAPSPGNVTGHVDLRARRSGRPPPPSARDPAAAASPSLPARPALSPEFRSRFRPTAEGERL
jgi:hypothetical protein